MIDYRSHVVAVDGLKISLAAKVFAEATVTVDRDKQIRPNFHSLNVKT